MTQRIAIMLSGGGRTMINLAEAVSRGDLNAAIVCVIASRECPGCDRARELGLDPIVMHGEIPAVDLERVLNAHRVDWVVLAGYLRKVQVPRAYTGRVVNIHPALLPRFGGPGMHGRHVHDAVLAAGETRSGCTVHLVDEQYDHGPIVLRRECEVRPGDTPESLAARVFDLECGAYPAALRQLFAAAERRDRE